MIVPLSGEVFETPEAIGRFARFLRELTGGLLAHDVHTAIAAYCELPGHDPRGDSALADPDEFAMIWNGLVGGTRVPVEAWEPVVLPAVVAFSNDTNLKAHLELATSFWVAARHASEALPVAITVHLPREPQLAEVVREPAPPAPASAPPPRRRQWWIWTIAFLLLLALIAALLLWWRSGRATAPTPASILDSGRQVEIVANEPTLLASPALPVPQVISTRLAPSPKSGPASRPSSPVTAPTASPPSPSPSPSPSPEPGPTETAGPTPAAARA